MTAPEVIVCATDGDLARQCAEWIAVRVARAVERRGRASLALAGGSTPRATYERLAGRALAPTIAWPLVDLYLGDERCVPPDDPRSNVRMVREALAGALERGACLHPMPVEIEDRDRAAAIYEAELPAVLDIVLLGLGGDGHTASLFPGSPALAERQQRVVAVRGPIEPRARLTITPPVVEAARHVAVLVAGPGKAKIVVRALDDRTPVAEIPARMACRGSWFLDQAAAALLARG